MAMKKNILILLLGLILFSGAHAQSPPIPLDPAIRTGKLPNGMTYYVRHNAEPKNRAELRLAVNAGSVLENDNQQGLAHFTEHMAFNGTTHFKKSELVDYLESIGTKFGAHLNAYTSFDETVYMLQVPTDDAAIMDKALTVLEDWAGGVSFDNAEIDKERGVVIEEWRLGQGADERMSKRYLPVLFHNSRYAERLPIGKKEILESFAYQTVKDFYNTWYRPELMAVIAVGDFDVDAMEKMIKDRFGKIPAKTGPARTLYPMPDHAQTLAAVETDKEAQFTIAQLFYKIPFKVAANEDQYREKMKGNLIISMLSKRLEEYNSKADAPWNFSFSSEFPLSRDKSALVLMGITAPEKAKRAMETLILEGTRITQHGFTAPELERAKAALLREMEQMLAEKDKTESSQFATRLVEHYLRGSSFASAEWRHEKASAIIPSITLEDVNAIAKTLFTAQNRVAIIAGLEKEGLSYPSKEELLTMIAETDAKSIPPYTEEVDNLPIVAPPSVPGKVSSTKTYAGSDATEWTLSNGAKVLLMPTDFKQDEILFQAVSVGGSSKVSDKDYYTARSAGAIAGMSGAGRLSKSKLDKKLAGKLVRLSISIDDAYEFMDGDCGVADFETLLQLIYVNFTNPRVDKEGYGAFMSQMATMKEMSASPEVAFEDSLRVALYNNHPRRQPMSDAIMASFNQQRAQEILLDRFGDASDFTFIFVGNVDPERAKPLIETWIGGIPGYARKEGAKDQNIRFATGVKKQTVSLGTEPKSTVQFDFTGSMECTPEQRFEMRAMIGVLNIMLREVLREEKGGTYGVRIYPSFTKLPQPTYRLTINFGCAPENAADLTAATLAQIKELIDNGPSEKNLQKVLETMRRSIETDTRDNYWWMDKLSDCVLYAENPETLNAIPEWVEKLNAAQVQAAAKRFLNLQNYLNMTMMPK